MGNCCCFGSYLSPRAKHSFTTWFPAIVAARFAEWSLIMTVDSHSPHYRNHRRSLLPQAARLKPLQNFVKRVEPLGYAHPTRTSSAKPGLVPTFRNRFCVLMTHSEQQPVTATGLFEQQCHSCHPTIVHFRHVEPCFATNRKTEAESAAHHRTA
jgi:hypothetical protein